MIDTRWFAFKIDKSVLAGEFKPVVGQTPNVEHKSLEIASTGQVRQNGSSEQC
jgi:hypothetical protein